MRTPRFSHSSRGQSWTFWKPHQHFLKLILNYSYKLSYSLTWWMQNCALRSQIRLSSPFWIWSIANPFSAHRLFCSIGFTYSIYVYIVWRYGIWVFFNSRFTIDKFYPRVAKQFIFSRNLCQSTLISILLHVYYLWRRAWGKISYRIPYNM